MRQRCRIFGEIVNKISIPLGVKLAIMETSGSVGVEKEDLKFFE